MSTTARILGALLIAGCGSSSSSSTSADDEESSATTSETAASPVASSSSAAAEATQLFQTRCSPCHGVDGKGDGPTSKALRPPPQNFQDPAWQSARQDGDIERAIQLGGAAVGKSPLMPPNPDLAARPEVIKALRAHIRKLVARP